MRKNVKFLIATLLVLCLAIIFALAGCETENNPEEDSEQYKIYAMAKESGYTGTYEEWLASIKGADGINGKEIELSVVDNNIVWRYVGTTQWKKIYSINDIIGPKGEDGEDGLDGVSITNTFINNKGELIFTFSDGKVVNVGDVVGENGQNGADGISVKKSEINEHGELVITYSDNNVVNLGKVVGANGTNGTNGQDGADGQNGVDGADGVSITKAEINNQSELVLTFSNGNVVNLGNIKGADGKDGAAGKDGVSVNGAILNNVGELILVFTNGNSVNLGNIKGADGQDGADGKDGASGKSAYEIYIAKHPEYTKTEDEWIDDLVNGELGTEKHKYGEWTVYNAPTQTTKGLLVKECEVCHEAKLVVLPMLNDVDYNLTIVDPTCTVQGKEIYKYSIEGQDVAFDVAIPALGHDYGEDFVCSRCGHIAVTMNNAQHLYESAAKKTAVSTTKFSDIKINLNNTIKVDINNVDFENTLTYDGDVIRAVGKVYNIDMHCTGNTLNIISSVIKTNLDSAVVENLNKIILEYDVVFNESMVITINHVTIWNLDQVKDAKGNQWDVLKDGNGNPLGAKYCPSELYNVVIDPHHVSNGEANDADGLFVMLDKQSSNNAGLIIDKFITDIKHSMTYYNFGNIYATNGVFEYVGRSDNSKWIAFGDKMIRGFEQCTNKSISVHDVLYKMFGTLDAKTIVNKLITRKYVTMSGVANGAMLESMNTDQDIAINIDKKVVDCVVNYIVPGLGVDLSNVSSIITQLLDGGAIIPIHISTQSNYKILS